MMGGAKPMVYKEDWPDGTDNQFTLQLRCPKQIRKYFPKHLFRGTVVIDEKQSYGITYKKILWIYYIESLKPGEGNVQCAITKLLKDGWDVRIVLPGNAMTHIAKKFGFVKRESPVRNYQGNTEHWMRPERCNNGYVNPHASDCAWCKTNKECKFKMFLEEYAYVI
jgi:hypothetical protein